MCARHLRARSNEWQVWLLVPLQPVGEFMHASIYRGRCLCVSCGQRAHGVVERERETGKGRARERERVWEVLVSSSYPHSCIIAGVCWHKYYTLSGQTPLPHTGTAAPPGPGSYLFLSPSLSLSPGPKTVAQWQRHMIWHGDCSIVLHCFISTDAAGIS